MPLGRCSDDAETEYIPEVCSTALFAPLPSMSLARVLALAAAAWSGDLACMEYDEVGDCLFQPRDMHECTCLDMIYQ